MNRSEIFKAAHKIAKHRISNGITGNYASHLAASLRIVYRTPAKAEAIMNTIAEIEAEKSAANAVLEKVIALVGVNIQQINISAHKSEVKEIMNGVSFRDLRAAAESRNLFINF